MREIRTTTVKARDVYTLKLESPRDWYVIPMIYGSMDLLVLSHQHDSFTLSSYEIDLEKKYVSMCNYFQPTVSIFSVLNFFYYL